MRGAAIVGSTPDEVRALALSVALVIIARDEDSCRRIGEVGRVELAGITKIMTHCNAGRLATAGWGTALGVIYAKAAAGERVHVMVPETRPLLQGSRLTAWELQDAGIDVTLMSDGSDASAMAAGRVEVVIVGADRIASNGDTANKVGTFSHAVNARYAGIPFYVAAPLSTFDISLVSGDEIEIKLRPESELTTFLGRSVAPPGTSAWTPAFDVTPAGLITAIITEVGVLRRLFTTSIREAFEREVS